MHRLIYLLTANTEPAAGHRSGGAAVWNECDQDYQPAQLSRPELPSGGPGWEEVRPEGHERRRQQE